MVWRYRGSIGNAGKKVADSGAGGRAGGMEGLLEGL